MRSLRATQTPRACGSVQVCGEVKFVSCADQRVFEDAAKPVSVPNRFRTVEHHKEELLGAGAPNFGLPSPTHARSQAVFTVNAHMLERLSAMLLAFAMSAALLLALGCNSTGGPSIELRPEAPSNTVSANSGADADGTGAAGTIESSAQLGFVGANGQAIALENGGRVPLGEDTVAEVFLSPYPPDWNTDLHLFLLSKDDFTPVTNVDVDLKYDMVFMDHGIDSQTGVKIAEGRYLMPLSFLMYGDWQVDVRMDSAATGKKHPQFVVKFLP